jgi:hypothetical protein
MAFVNEMIPSEDVEKYGLKKINKQYLIADYYSWTVNREKNVYLRWMRNERDALGISQFTFYWKGTLLPLRMKSHGEGKRHGKGWTRWSFCPHGDQIIKKLFLTPDLIPFEDQIMGDIKEAFIVYKDGGLSSTIAEHTAYFEF